MGNYVATSGEFLVAAVTDSASRPGKPLRDLLRAGQIKHAKQEANGRWFIVRASMVESICGGPPLSHEIRQAKSSTARRPRTQPSSSALDAVAEATHQLAVESDPVDGLRALPAVPGLYTLAVRDVGAIAELGLEDLEPDTPLASRILYLGKAESSIASRLGGTHLATGKSGHSTVRRTFENDGLHWPRRDGLKWPHFASVVVLG